MDRQVRNLLELSSTQQQASDPVPVDLSHVAEAAVESLREDIEQTNATINLAPLPTVRGRRVLLQSVFVNLISNALKYRNPSESLSITIDHTTTQDTHRVHVVDNGPGIDPEDRERIFRLFERASTTAAGSGIGLGLSRRVIEAFGGTLSYEAPGTNGSCFVITFPVIDNQDADDCARTS